MNKNFRLTSLVERVTNLWPRPDREGSVSIPKRLTVEVLEPRILFSGAPASAAAPVEAPAAEPATQEAPAAAAANTPAPVAESEVTAVVSAPPVAAADAAPAAPEAAPAAVAITNEELSAVVAAANRRWIDSGISGEQAVALAGINYQIADLGGTHLGATNGTTITIDDDAAGSGSWFIDTTPDQDEEFTTSADTLLNALSTGAAAGKFDLLTVILHEQGHLLGLADSRASGGIMDEILATGVRVLPAGSQSAGATPGPVDGPSFISAPDFNPITFTFDTFTGAGFNSAPAAGQLDSDDWTVSGFSDAPNTLPFGGSAGPGGDFARGSSNGGVTTGGIYAFDINGAGDRILGVQPSGSDFTPGTMTLQVQNNTGGTVNQWNLAYDIAVLNDQGRANSFNLEVAVGTAGTPGAFSPLAAFDFTTPEAADGAPAWVTTPMAGTLNATVADGQFLFIQWTSNDVSGAGSRDEFGLNNVVVQAVAPMAAPSLVISEVMYDPNSPEDDWEWIELANTGAADIDLSGWVVDDINSVAHGAANIASGTIAAGGTAILYNADDISAADFEAAWGAGANLIAVTNWSAMGLNNGGDTIGLWNSFASYSGNHATHAATILSVTYPDLGVGASVYITDLTDQNSWMLSTVGAFTPAGGTAYQSTAANGNTGMDIGSPLEPQAITGETAVRRDANGTLIIEDVMTTGDDELFITSDGTNLTIYDPNQTVGTNIPGATAPAPGTVVVPLASFLDIIIRTNGGNDIINIVSLTGFNQSLTVEDGAGFDFVNYSASIMGAADENYAIAAEKILLGPGSAIVAAGAGTINLAGTGGGPGVFEGVKIKNSTLTTVDGGITINGTGATAGGGNEGVQISYQSAITTTGAGSINITGQGGGTGAGSNNIGVSILEASTISTGAAGGVTITGTGGGLDDSHGVTVLHGSTVTGGAAGVTINGTGTGTGVRNNGVYTTASTLSASGGGSVIVNGTGSQSAAAGVDAKGVRLSASSTVSVTGAGAITINGTGGTGTSTNEGVHIGLGTGLTTAAGGIGIFGTGNGTETVSHGVSFLGGSSATSGGALNVTGTGSGGTSSISGVSLVNAMLSATGATTIVGTSAGTTYLNRGITSVNATIAGSAVTLTGTASTASSSSFNEGVALSGTTITTTGTLTIAGIGGTGMSSNNGVRINGGSLSGTLDIDGTANALATGNGNIGTYLTDVNTTAVLGGDIAGTGGGGTLENHGIIIQRLTGGFGGTTNGTAGAGFSKAKAGDFFNILPVLVAMAAAEKRSRQETLGNLMARLPDLSAEANRNSVEIYREQDNLVQFQRIMEDAGALEEAGIAVPAGSEGSRSVILLVGEDDEAVSGIAAQIGTDGQLKASAPLEAPAGLTVAELLDRLTENGQSAWSVPSRGRYVPAENAFSEVFGL